MFSIVIPAYNEGDSVSKTVLFIRDVMEKLGEVFEIIVVNDGSTDSTKDHCQFDDARIRLISHIQNLGYGASLKTGIRSASYDTIIITDADLTYPFEELPQLLKDYQAGFDMVVGRRTGEFYRESIIKSPLRKILKGLVEFAAGRSIPDINSGFRIFRKKDVTPFLNRLCNTFSFTTSMTLAYMMNLKTVSYVDIPYHKREGQTKVRLFKDAMRTLQYIIQAINFYNPLKLFLLLFWMSMGISIASVMIGFIFQLKTLFIVGAGLSVMSFMFLGLGLLADLLKQIMDKQE